MTPPVLVSLNVARSIPKVLSIELFKLSNKTLEASFFNPKPFQGPLCFALS